MRFQPIKCNIMQIQGNGSRTLEGTVLDNVEKIKYLGITITKNLKWNTSAIFEQRPIGPLASLDVTWRHVHRMLKSHGLQGTMSSPGVW